jgi:hypothetical protein
MTIERPRMARLERARARVQSTVTQGSDRLWRLRVDALERVDELLESAESAPVLGRVASAGGQLVERRLERLTKVPVDGWNELNAKNAIAAVRDLDRRGLWAARRREEATKNRKTVLRAIDKALEPVGADDAQPASA